jgi:hypothetical protein
MNNDETRKWEFLKNAPVRDAATPEILEIAQPLWTVAKRSPWVHWAFAKLAMAVARDCIQYQLDSDRVGREQIDGLTDPQGPADTPLRRGYDDCDAKARLFVALCLSLGIPAEMVPRWKDGRLAHVYGRAMVTGPNEVLPRWYYAETILSRARLGEVAENVPKELETGKWAF